MLTASDGKRVTEIFSNQADLQAAITDWMMPELDGLQLYRLVRADKRLRYTYILILTALAGKENYLEALDAGADDFVTKPVEEEELKARLRVAERILGLQAEVKQLQGLLSICAYCKKIAKVKK